MQPIKSMAIGAIIIILLVFVVPTLQGQVAPSVNSTATYNLSVALSNSLIQLSPYALFALAAAAVIGGLTQL